MLKRSFDLLVSLVILLLLSPLLVVVSLVVIKKMGRPVLFKQPRPGLNNKIFYMQKFRSMSNAKDKKGNLLPDEKRITSFGLFLRNSSIDELPGLWSVLKGDMSLVGPRPLLVEYLERYSTEQARRHNVKPGITGWAQVSGRNSLSWEEKFKLDVWYVDNQSMWLDLKILFLTVKKVFFKEDISQVGHATMPIFKGNNKADIDKNKTSD
jgi:sugar transferase EpsL